MTTTPRIHKYDRSKEANTTLFLYFSASAMNDLIIKKLNPEASEIPYSNMSTNQFTIKFAMMILDEMLS